MQRALARALLAPSRTASTAISNNPIVGEHLGSKRLVCSCISASASSTRAQHRPRRAVMSSTRRATMVSKHLSSAASPSSSTSEQASRQSSVSKTLPELGAMQQAVQLSHESNLYTITLNRPKALNSLNLDMMNIIKPALRRWKDKQECKLVLIKGAGRAFCAGGDVVAIVQGAKEPAGRAQAMSFFRSEYEIDNLVAKYPKTVISLLDGFTMGGGVGISVHGHFRVATENTLFKMPETTIGLYPDVGVTFFLARMDGELGTYLGLTSQGLNGWAAYQARIATHYIHSDRLPALEQRLAELDITDPATDVNALVNDTLNEYTADATVGEKDPTPSAAETITSAQRKAIDRAFAHDSIEEIQAELERTVSGEDSDVAEWASRTLTTLKMRSPTSLKVTLQAIRNAAKLDIDQTFRMDMRLAGTFCDPDIAPDFFTGVHNQLIQKDKELRKQRPQWYPSEIAEVSSEQITADFFANESKTSVPIPELDIDSSLPAYTEYPHERNALPSEEVIGSVVKGNWPSVGSFALKPAQVVRVLEKDWTAKPGLRHKIEETLIRRATVSQDGTLKWQY